MVELFHILLTVRPDIYVELGVCMTLRRRFSEKVFSKWFFDRFFMLFVCCLLFGVVFRVLVLRVFSLFRSFVRFGF